MLTAFSDGELTPEAKEQISLHLDACADCRHELEELNRLSKELDRLEAVEVRPYFMTRVKQRIADRQAKRAAVKVLPGWVRRTVIPVGAAALVFLTALTGSYLGRTVYRWRSSAESGSTPNHGSAGSILFDESSEGSLSRFTDQLLDGGKSE